MSDGVETSPSTPVQRKLLALDGGGIRGVISLEVLDEVERTLRRALDAGEDFVLADYFDYFAGTSTGAVIATGLALGWPVSRLRDLYANSGRDMFDRAFVLDRWKNKFSGIRLADMLRREFGAETTFGSPEFRALLMIVLRNATTDSHWPLSNNPLATFNDPTRSDNNLNLPLWQLVRASTAAPLFYPPERIAVDRDQRFVFVDGGVTVYNNPAFQLFLMATLPQYRLGWEFGEDRMLLVSVGTGSVARPDKALEPSQMNVASNLVTLPGALMFAAATQQDTLCRIFGRCRHGAQIDVEIGDLQETEGLLAQRHFTYLRYDADLSRPGLDELGLHDIDPVAVRRLDSIDHIGDLQRVGMRLASSVDVDHFRGFLHERAQSTSTSTSTSTSNSMIG